MASQQETKLHVMNLYLFKHNNDILVCVCVCVCERERERERGE
jgi:hypothetical protein